MRALLISCFALAVGCRTLPLDVSILPDEAPDAGSAPDLATGPSSDLANPNHDLSFPPFPPGCAGFDEYTCKKHSECKADYCSGCGCDFAFVGCREQSQPAHSCPGLGCDEGFCCRVNMDCGDAPGYTCRPPGYCPPNASCIGCTDATCPVGTQCSSNGGCLPYGGEDVCISCATGLVCDAAGGRPLCVHQTCASDKDCEIGACVDGTCYRQQLGMCRRD